MAKLWLSVFLAVYLSSEICFGGFPGAPWYKGANVCKYQKPNIETNTAKFARSCGPGNERLCRRFFGFFSSKPKPVDHYYDCCPGWTNKGSLGCLKRTCVMVPQDAGYFTCKGKRKTYLVGENLFYKLTTPPEEPLPYPNKTSNLHEAVSFPLLDQPSAKVVGKSLLVPALHEQKWVIRYIGMAQRNKILTKKTLQTIKPFTKYSDYADLLAAFRAEQPKDIISLKIPGSDKTFDVVSMEQYMKYPSQEVPFKDIIGDDTWQDDDVFVQQRLAGLNPMALRKMTHEDFMQDYINREFDWDDAVQRVSGEKFVFKDMIDEGRLYIIDYKHLYDVTNVDDLTELNSTDRREMAGSRSPFCIFVTVNDGGVNELKPVAIQTDLRSDAPVRSPIDGSKWLMAKMEIQRADITYAELIEHLLKTHLLMEPICVIMRRTLSKYHPLYQIFQWHCRGLFVTNSLGIQALLLPEEFLHKLFTIGHTGAVEVLNKAYPSLSWDDTDFYQNLKRRGLDNVEELPYFPYRDDGLLSWKEVGDFATEYVNLYYAGDEDVAEDFELEKFANQLSADGTGSHGGIGMLQRFPNKITTKVQLTDVVKRVVFIPIQHHAVNYPVAYYGAFVPNLPTKLYNDPRVPPQEFGFHTLPQSHVATEQIALSMSLGSLRYDIIFDYGKHIEDDRARAVVNKYHARFVGTIDDQITKRNNKRLADRKMSYPYLLPKWMPNSIHT